jgi:D-arabinose 1-dehydrogenase-like Zn-dependent alcohol dehydrogenase
MDDLLQHAVAGHIKPAIEVVEFSRISEVMEQLKSGAVTGRVVVKILE